MPSARRIRLLLFTTVLTTLVLYYLNSGSRHTEASPFYQKTVALMNSKAKAAAAADRDHTATDHDPDDTLRDRLKDAEAAAKKGADEKFPHGPGAAPAIPAAAAPAITLPPDYPIPPAKADMVAPANNEKVLNPDAAAAAVAANAPILPPGADADSPRKPYPKPDGVGSPDGVAKVGNVGPGGAAAQEAAAAAAAAAAATSVSSSSSAEAAAKTELSEAEARTAAKAELDELLARHVTLIFSKTYCPHSKRAKQILLEAHRITPAPHVVELDQHPLGPALQQLLARATGRGTVPNVIVNGKSVGGGDEMQGLWEVGKVAAVWERYGRGKAKVEVLEKWGAKNDEVR